jgi:hypothetical protein
VWELLTGVDDGEVEGSVDEVVRLHPFSSVEDHSAWSLDYVNSSTHGSRTCLSGNGPALGRGTSICGSDSGGASFAVAERSLRDFVRTGGTAEGRA